MTTDAHLNSAERATGRVEPSYEHIEVAGGVIQTMARAISADALCRRLLEKHGISQPVPTRFYPFTDWLKLLHELQERMPTVLKNAGCFIAEEALLPPQFTSLDPVMVHMDEAYYANHRGCQPGEIGHYVCDELTGGGYRMTVTLPYPCLYVHGVLEGFVRRFGTTETVEHLDLGCSSEGARTCVFEIRS